MTIGHNPPMHLRSPCRLSLPARLGLLLLACWVPLALAHGLNLSLQAAADGVVGQAFYADGTPARNEAVTLFGTDADKPLAEASTDAQGRFRLPLTVAGSYRVVVDGDEGHRAEAAIVWTPVTAAPAADSAAALAAAVRAEVAPLREDIARLQARVRLSDLVGGIGFVVGLFGAYAWWRARPHR
jgi:nickel transport protein